MRLDEEEEGDGLNEAEKRARRNARLLDVKKGVPNDRRSIWKFPVEWAAVGEVRSRYKYMFEESADIFIRKTDSNTKQDQTVRSRKDSKLPWRVG